MRKFCLEPVSHLNKIFVESAQTQRTILVNGEVSTHKFLDHTRIQARKVKVVVSGEILTHVPRLQNPPRRNDVRMYAMSLDVRGNQLRVGSNIVVKE